MRVLFIGDVFGRPGRYMVKNYVHRLRKEWSLDLVIANVENLAGGAGVTERTVVEMLDAGVDIMTSGNHIWDKRENLEKILTKYPVLRPANWQGVPGNYKLELEIKGKSVLVLNVCGQLFTQRISSPFTWLEKERENFANYDNVFIDVHAETTAEKLSIAYWLDGEVSCVVGTHTHVQTADERILPNGTAYISDLGMTGPVNSVIGVIPKGAIARFRYPMFSRYNVQMRKPYVLSGLVVEFSGREAVWVKRVQIQES